MKKMMKTMVAAVLMIAAGTVNILAATSNDVPQGLSNILLYDNGDGTVTLSWDAVSAVGAGGGTVNTDEVTYKIYDRMYNVLAEGVTQTSYTFSGIEQTSTFSLLLYRVSAVNSIGEGEIKRSSFIILGQPLTLPFIESTAGGKAQQEWWTEQNADEPFQVSTAGSSDDDGGCMGWYTQKAGEDATTSTAKVSLQGAVSPVIFLSYYAMPGKKMSFDVVVNKSGRDDVTLATFDFQTDTGEAGWRNVTLPISNMLGENYIVMRLKARSNETSGNILLIDNIRIYDQPQHNLAIRLSPPTQCIAGQPSVARVNITNYGANAADGYTVKLYVGDRLAETVTGNHVDAGEDCTIDIDFLPTAALPKVFNMRAEVVYDADLDDSDDQSNVADVALVVNDNPGVENLSAEENGGLVTLTWTEPQTESSPKTESFEDYAPFSIDNMGSWTLYDGDGMQTFGIQGIDFPNEVTPKAFIVVNPSEMTYDEFYVDVPPAEDPAFAPHTGNQYLMCFDPDTYYDASARADDWIISPLLSGESQTISLWAHSFDSYDRETLEILYSETDNDHNHFTMLKRVSNVASEWTEITAQLPTGAKYFAIRVVSADKWALFLDDVTFTPASPTITAYNIYRDGELAATVSSGQTSFTDNTATNGSHQYAVSVMYEDGESVLSETVTATTSGIASVEANENPAAFYNTAGMVLSKPQRGINIIRKADGQRVKVLLK